MPKTSITFLIACLSIAGFPLLAGFFSKDEILWRTFSSGRGWLYLLALLTALLTAIYSFRAYFLAFEGKPRLPEHTRARLHESPWTMTAPLIVLALGSIFAGFLNLPPAILGHGHHGLVTHLLDPVLAPAEQILAAHARHEVAHHGLAMEWALMFVSIAVGLGGIGLAWLLALRAWPDLPTRLARNELIGMLYQLSAARWWWDDFYNFFVAGGLRLIARLAVWCDHWIIDGILHGAAGLTARSSRAIRALQSGQVQAYAVAILLGVNLLILLVILL